jgi:hypothetical protein
MSIYRIRLIETLVDYKILLNQEVLSTSNVLKSVMIFLKNPFTYLCVDPHDHIV